MFVYADNAATTAMSRAAVEAMTPAMHQLYGNPSSLHQKGREANYALMDARDLEGHRFEVSTEDPAVQPEAVLEDQELQETLAQGIASLQKNEQIVLSLYYEKNLHMKEIAQVMGVSEPRISQIHSRAIQKLREHMGAYMNSEAPKKPSKKRKKA